MQSPRYGRRHDLDDTSDHLKRQDHTNLLEERVSWPTGQPLL